jgi:hypothetical protein
MSLNYFANLEFLRALPHNPPFGAGRGALASLRRSEPEPHPWRVADPSPAAWRVADPDPVPWAVAFLVSAVSAKVTAASMANKEAAQQAVAAADASIARFLDDWCGTPHPGWPFPGPPPWVWIISSEVTFVANTLQDGQLRTGLVEVAGKVADRGSAPAPLAQ